jgi:hypothetical protein
MNRSPTMMHAIRQSCDNPLTWHDVAVKHLRRAHVEELLGRSIATPHKAKHLLVAIRKLIYVGLRQDWIEIDPTAAIEWRPATSAGKHGHAKRCSNLSSVGRSALLHAPATGSPSGWETGVVMTPAGDAQAAAWRTSWRTTP